jgi:pyruvyltransferase
MSRVDVLPGKVALHRKLSAVLAREASLAFDQIPPLARSGELQASDLRSVIDASVVKQLSDASRVRVGSINDLSLLVLAALTRSGVLIDDQQLVSLGFRDIRGIDEKDPIAVKSALDFNFDRAVDLFVEESVWQGDIAPPSSEYLESRFVENGHIPLMIMTHESEPARIGWAGNVGDNFGVHVVKHLSRLPVRPFNFQTELTTPAMLSVGSTLDHAGDRGLVWGTGFMGRRPIEGPARKCESVFLGVRGPRSREEIIRQFAINPPVIGDPGLLIREVVPSDQGPERRFGFVIHKVDKEFFQAYWPDVFSVENQRSPQELVRDILSCSAIVSTSLHGLIFSHALGVPAAIIKVGDRLAGNEFKFVDYYHSVGHYGFAARPDLSHVPQLSESDWIELVASTWQPARPPDVSRLCDAFPFRKSISSPGTRIDRR